MVTTITVNATAFEVVLYVFAVIGVLAAAFVIWTALEIIQDPEKFWSEAAAASLDRAAASYLEPVEEDEL